MDSRSTLLARLFGAIDVIAALVVVLGVFVGLPARWWVVDVPSAIVAGLLAVAGAGLIARKAWGEQIARVASMVALVVGLALVATLGFTASYLSGIYGPVGRGGAVILVLVAALTLPYLVALPAAQLLWLGPRARPVLKPAADASAAPTVLDERAETERA